MGTESGPPERRGDLYRVQIGRLELRGASARRLLKTAFFALGVLIACVPGAMAFYAYAEGGTSLWAAIAFAVTVPAAVGFWLFRAR
jgi:hypothetical protein